MNGPTPYLNARVLAESSAVDNNVATATAAAVVGVRHFMTGVIVSFSAAPAAAYKTITVKLGTTAVANFAFDPLKAPLVIIPFPSPIHGDYNQAVSAVLSASGTGGVTGTVTLFGWDQ
jgi:hypothetical protein